MNVLTFVQGHCCFIGFYPKFQTQSVWKNAHGVTGSPASIGCESSQDFHTCIVCQLARITKCLNTKEKNEKRTGGHAKS